MYVLFKWYACPVLFCFGAYYVVIYIGAFKRILLYSIMCMSGDYFMQNTCQLEIMPDFA